jgi:hypothetical protein
MIAPQNKVPKNFSLKPGSLVGDFPSLLMDTSNKSSVKCVDSGSIFIFMKKELKRFLEEYPSVYIMLKDKFLLY